MGYQIRNHYKSKDGALIWRIVYEFWKDGKREQRTIPKDEWLAIGFSPTMTRDEAKGRAKQLNSEAWLKNRERKRQEIALRLVKEDKVECAYLPEPFVQQFEQDVLFKRFGRGDQKTVERKKLTSHWRAVRRLIRDVNISPSDWADQPQTIYAYFEKIKASPSYTQKLIRMMNLWGYFISKKTAQPFLQLENPRGYDREQIADAFFEKDHSSKVSAPITPAQLENAKGSLSHENYNWIYISVWFGLRPQEVEQLKSEGTWEIVDEGGVKVLRVYQSKLRSVTRDQRWKLIPVIYKEQEIALELIMSQKFKKPLAKTVRKWINAKATTYGGRKGFTDLMLGRGQRFEDISLWLGHTSIETTWRKYKDRLRVHFKKAG